MINLKDKKILVTGGSRGIGKEIVNFLLKAGAEVSSLIIQIMIRLMKH